MMLYEIRQHDVVEVFTGDLAEERVVFHGLDDAEVLAVGRALARVHNKPLFAGHQQLAVPLPTLRVA
jgi:hypothetical protein